MEAIIFEAGYQQQKLAFTQKTTATALITSHSQDFEQLFKEHFKSLYAYAYTILKDEVLAEETVQHVFYKIWEKKILPDIQTSIKSYLYKAVYHDSLNHLKHRKIRAQYQVHVMHQNKQQPDPASKRIMLKELEEKLRVALNELPQQCRTIFQLSRFEGLKYHEIAHQLGISAKTVENQMGKALKQLRIKLADFIPLIIVSLFQF